MRYRITSTSGLFNIILLCAFLGEGRCGARQIYGHDTTAAERALVTVISQSSVEGALLTVTSDSSGYFLFLDNAPLAKTPLYDHPLIPGSHTLKAFHYQQTIWGLPPWHREFVAGSGEKVHFHIPLLRSYSIYSTPFDAEAYVDGNYLGMTPTYFEYQGSSDAFLEIRKEGYQGYAGHVTTRSPASIEVRLLPTLDIQESLRKMLHREHSVRTRKRILSWGFLGATLLSGAASIQFKQKADDSYAAYMNSGRPDEMNRHFNDARRNDKYATLAYGGFQLSFILWAYFFFTSR